jgi:hypothetical protein
MDFLIDTSQVRVFCGYILLGIKWVKLIKGENERVVENVGASRVQIAGFASTNPETRAKASAA